MAQLRQDCQIFLALRNDVFMVAPKGPETIVSYISSHEITYTGVRKNPEFVPHRPRVYRGFVQRVLQTLITPLKG